MTKTEQVKEFHDKFDVSVASPMDFVSIEQRKLLIREEFLEVLTALNSGNPEAILKECCDLVYVTIGTAVKFDMNFDEAFNRVHASNMTKVWEDGRPRYREDGKVLKPPTYKSPDLKDLT
jgi:predicted HAD superfamily Cof-like phosphohydrolase